MANIGSAFLGDVQAQRIRHLSSPTSSIGAVSPPSSPPPIGIGAGMGFSELAVREDSDKNVNTGTIPDQDKNMEQKEEDKDGKKASWTELSSNIPTTTNIDPLLALELRIRWLEVLVLGLDSVDSTVVDAGTNESGKRVKRKKDSISTTKMNGRDRDWESHSNPQTQTLARLTEAVQRRLDAIVGTNEGLRRFMQSYDQYAQYLTPTFALSTILSHHEDQPVTPTNPSTSHAPVESNQSPYESLMLELGMSSAELEAYLNEMDPDIRIADREMQEVESLVNKGVLGAGKLGDFQALKPRLEALIKNHEEDVKLAAQLEKRVRKLVERHATHVDALSELFVAWDDALLEAESRTRALEKEWSQRERLGLVA